MGNTAKDQIIKGLTKNFDLGEVITILEGEAPEQHNPEPVDISGTITAPSRFLEKREGEFYDKKAHCLVSKSDGKIELVINEQSVVDKYTIDGKVYVGKLFESLGINIDKPYSPIELSKKLRLLRSIFLKPSQHANIVATLRNITAKVNQQIDNNDDLKGNRNVAFKQTVESNIPDSFKIKLPLLEGEDPVEIELNVILMVESGTSITCYLESVDGAEMIDKERERLINEEVEKIEKLVTVIYY